MSARTVTSPDGTRIAISTAGSGPSLVIVGGALADGSAYASLATELAPHFTVYTFDRRARGGSEASGTWSVEREVEDVASVVRACESPVCVYGHSAGAALALRAAAAGVPMAQLVLADPPWSPRDVDDAAERTEHAEQAAELERLVAAGDLAGAVRTFLGGFGLSEAEVNELLATPAGSRLRALARTLPYDYAVLGDGLVPVAMAAGVSLPTLVLAAASEGVTEDADTHAVTPDAAQQLAQALPNARLVRLDAPVHALAPTDVASTLVTHLAR